MAQLKRTGQDGEEEIRYSSLAILDGRPHNVVWTRRDLHQNNQLPVQEGQRQGDGTI